MVGNGGPSWPELVGEIFLFRPRMVKKLIRGKLEQNLRIGPLAGVISNSPCTGKGKATKIEAWRSTQGVVA